MAGSLPIGRSASEGKGAAYRGIHIEGRLQGRTGSASMGGRSDPTLRKSCSHTQEIEGLSNLFYKHFVSGFREFGGKQENNSTINFKRYLYFQIVQKENEGIIFYGFVHNLTLR